MSEEMQECQNCHVKFPQSKIATHFGYCRRNIKRCDQCGEMYDINCVQQHEEEFHKKVSCQFCKRQFGPSQINTHSKNCHQKPKFCEYCELKVPPQEFNTHLVQCESRTKVCDKCRQPIMNKDYLIHMTTCPGYIPKQEKKPNAPQNYGNYGQFIEEQREKFEYPKKEYMKVNYDYKQYEKKPAQSPTQFKQPTKNDTYGLNKPDPYQKYRVNPKSYEGAEKKEPGYSRGSKERTFDKPSEYKEARNPQYQRGTRNYPTSDSLRNPGINKNQPTKVSIANQGKKNVSRPMPEVNKKEQNRPTYGYSNTRNTTKSTSNNPTASYQRNYPTSETHKKQDNLSSKPETNYRPRQYEQPKHDYEPVRRQYDQPSQGFKKPKKEAKVWDPQEYGGYINDDQLPESVFKQETRKYQEPKFDDFPTNEDEELQKAILMSMQSKNSPTRVAKKKANIPKEFQTQDLMSQSFYNDLDLEKQKKIYEQAQRKGGRRY